MKCPFCNQEIEDESKFCTFCGKELTIAPKKGKRWVIPAAAVAVVAVAAGAYAMSQRVDPKDAVIDAFKSITAEGQTNPAEEIFGISDLMEKLSKESGEISMEATIAGASDETVNQLASGKMRVNVKNDVDQKKLSMDIGLGYADMDLAGMELYLDETQVAAAIPELSSRAFTLNYADDLEGQLEASPYLGSLLQENGVDITGLSTYLEKCTEMASEGEELFNLKELWHRYKEGSKAIDDLKAAMTAEKVEKKDFIIDGSTESCRGYHVTVTKDALVQFARTTKEFFLNDETLKSDFISYMEMVTELQNTMAELQDPSLTQSPEEMQKELWQNAEAQFDDVLSQLEASMGDVTLNVYVRKGGTMAGFDFATIAKVEDQEVALDGSVTFGGGYSMISNVTAVLNMNNVSITDADDSAISFTLNKTGGYEAGNTWFCDLNATLESGEESFGFIYNGSYQIADGSLAVSLDLLDGEESQLSITSTGYVQNLQKGTSLELCLDSVRFSSPLLTGAEDYFELSGSYAAGPLTGEVAFPEGENFDILAATEDDYNGVISEMTGNIFGLMMKFYR